MALEEEKKGAKTVGGSDRELETLVLLKVGDVASAVDAAKQVDEVICALYSLAVRLFPVDSSALCDAIDQTYRSQVFEIMLPNNDERNLWKKGFYHGAAFAAMSQILLYNVATRWLSSFPSSAKKQVYDSFFVEGPPTEVIQVLVPALKHVDDNTICSNIERLLKLSLLENEGICRMLEEVKIRYRNGKHSHVLKEEMFSVISRVAQLLVSIPDKARLQAPSALKSHFFFQQIVIQLLVGAEESCKDISNEREVADIDTLGGVLLLMGETFSRICRRGSADILLIKMIPRIHDHVCGCLSSEFHSIVHNQKSGIWLYLMEAIKDQYSVERLSEELLRQLAAQNVNDVEAYWILWLLFHRSIKQKAAIRNMFVDKFLFWKVLPICCLRWILQFTVFECAPNTDSPAEGGKTSSFLDLVHRLVTTWSRREFVQSSSIEQQAYVTAAVGLCVERMSKEELETTKDILHSILHGVSCRLESPIDLVRKMASSIALAFSKVVDPENPLYLDDDCSGVIDWEFGLTSLRRVAAASSKASKKESRSRETKIVSQAKSQSDVTCPAANGGKMISELSYVNQVEIVDPSRSGNERVSADEDDKDDKTSEASNDSSLQPYDLSDDDTDLQNNLTQLSDLAAALRKPDDPDGVERALDIAEKLVRASPDELCHHSADLVRALVHVRCSDFAVEGEEESAEGKRQKALVALLVTSPFESLDVLTRLVYSSSVDVSQRILILDVMTEAAEELSESTITRTNHQQRNLISDISGGQPWFIPSSRGPLGASPWKEVSEPGTSISWSHRYEREVPSRPGQIKSGKSRKWGFVKAKDPQFESSKNRFPLYAAAFMLPVMQGFDKRRHGVDLLNRDFIVLGKLIYMLGVCMKCVSMHPEASDLAPALLDMLRSRELSHHAEAYVRRSVLFAASCILVALHPSHVAAALIEGNQEISIGLEWIRTWALQVAESETDTECSSMAMTCLQLHSEMALQTSRALESAECFKPQRNTLPTKLDKIIIPFSNMG